MSRSHIPKALRDRVADQARHRCGYCLTPEWIVGTPMEIDHLIPESIGGVTEEEILWLACSLCNDVRNSRIAHADAITGEVVRLFNPRHQDWREHFRWSDDGELIMGLTSTGRATVIALNLNRSILVLARRAWVSVGWHPPAD